MLKGQKQSEGSKGKELAKCCICSKEWFDFPYTNRRSPSKRYCSLECRHKRKHSRETIEKMSMVAKLLNRKPPSRLGIKGEKCGKVWKGGITPINNQIRGSFASRVWQKSVFTRDKNTCQKCRLVFILNKLAAHHILNFSTNPKLRLDINNGITFCRLCHKKFHIIYGKINNSREQVIEFLKNYEKHEQ